MSPTERWQAVMARDRRFDGAFVYAVRSTGIYCRPSCGSRKPRRTQVSFFPIPEAAEREGFRACRRCHPAAANGSDPTVALVREACRAIAAGQVPPGDPRRLARAFKRILGITPRAYAEVAKAIGQPKATRAVARACATNPAALVIPCHRVVRADGKVDGYRWGLERKKTLLEMEKNA